MRGTLTDTVYACYGAMEDWAYGVGWDNSKGSHTNTCKPKSNLDFNYANYQDVSMIKPAIYLVETSHFKAPPASAYGSDDDPMTKGNDDGYIP